MRYLGNMLKLQFSKHGCSTFTLNFLCPFKNELVLVNLVVISQLFKYERNCSVLKTTKNLIQRWLENQHHAKTRDQNKNGDQKIIPKLTDFPS